LVETELIRIRSRVFRPPAARDQQVSIRCRRGGQEHRIALGQVPVGRGAEADEQVPGRQDLEDVAATTRHG